MPLTCTKPLERIETGKWSIWNQQLESCGIHLYAVKSWGNNGWAMICEPLAGNFMRTIGTHGSFWVIGFLITFQMLDHHLLGIKVSQYLTTGYIGLERTWEIWKGMRSTKIFLWVFCIWPQKFIWFANRLMWFLYL